MRMCLRLWTQYNVSFGPCGVSALLDSLWAAAVHSACAGARMLSLHSEWRRSVASLHNVGAALAFYVEFWSLLPCLGLSCPSLAFWHFWLEHRLL